MPTKIKYKHINIISLEVCGVDLTCFLFVLVRFSSCFIQVCILYLLKRLIAWIYSFFDTNLF